MTQQNQATEQELSPEAERLLKNMQEVRSRILTMLQGEDVTTAASACLDAALIIAYNVDPHTRASFAKLLMGQAHAMSGHVSAEQADGPMTANQEIDQPKIILGN